MKKISQRSLDAQHRAFSVLSNLNRLAIINELRAAKKPLTLQGLQTALNISIVCTRDHVNALRTAGIVKPAAKTRNGPNAQIVELTESVEQEDLFGFMAGATEFKKLFKQPRAKNQSRDTELRLISAAE